MSQPDLQIVKNTCEAFIASAGAATSWSMDGRFSAVMAQFDSETASPLHELLEKQFPPAWIPQSLASAPPAVQGIAKSLGGLQQGQELFVTDPDKPPSLVAAWWPWGGGANVSIRFLLWSEAAEATDLKEQLKSWFGI